MKKTADDVDAENLAIATIALIAVTALIVCVAVSWHYAEKQIAEHERIQAEWKQERENTYIKACMENNGTKVACRQRWLELQMLDDN